METDSPRHPVTAPAPPLLLVSGAPASGKSVLARRLSVRRGLPLLARDAYKEVLFDTLGSPDRARSHELGIASYALLYASIGWLLDAGVGAVVDCNFHRGASEPLLEPLVPRARAVLLHCETTREERDRRHVERYLRGERHPGHHDSVMPPEVQANVDAGIFDPLDLLPLATLRINTTDGYRPGWTRIDGFIDEVLDRQDMTAL